jgi:copper chaperone CopZ
METTTLELPMMYADHHVIEVRKLLASIPGVEDVYASSCFHIVEVSYDESAVDDETIRSRLNEAGYTGDLAFPVESGTDAAAANGGKTFFRHTAVFEQVGDVVSFAQRAPYEGRPLWPCPGVGPLAEQD